ncbi:hypothetical protein L195_g062117, partial [Trifolium pratense]
MFDGMVLTVTDLSWSGVGGCDDYELKGCGGEVLMWRYWIWRRQGVVDV